ncbi:hypothetical protein Tco_0553506 [Tanacetum coccineum]
MKSYPRLASAAIFVKMEVLQCNTSSPDDGRVSVYLAWLVGELTLSSLDVLQGFSFFLQMGFTLILATLDGLDVGLLGDVIGQDDCDDDG